MKNEVEYFKRITDSVAENSTCGAAKVGAVIVHPKFRTILSTGYNGAPRGTEHCGEICDNRQPGGAGKEHCKAVHAEINAIANAARVGVEIDDGILCLSMTPCLACARVIINAGITSVVCYNIYPQSEAVDLLDEAGVLVTYWDGEDFHQLTNINSFYRHDVKQGRLF